MLGITDKERIEWLSSYNKSLCKQCDFLTEENSRLRQLITLLHERLNHADQVQRDKD